MCPVVHIEDSAADERLTASTSNWGRRQGLGATAANCDFKRNKQKNLLTSYALLYLQSTFKKKNKNTKKPTCFSVI